MIENSYIELERFDEENEEDFSTRNIERFSEAVIWGTDWTIETIVNQIEKGNIELSPKFQRRDAWDEVEKSKLIESLMLGIPVPPIILAEKKDKRGKYIVIDGKQRLLSIAQYCLNNTEFKTLKLKGLEYLSVLNGKTYKEIDEDFNLSAYKDQLDNQTIRAVVIKNWPSEEFLFTVFLRLNTGSKQLSPQELRQALHPGEFLDYLDNATAESETFMKLLRNREPDSRMRDVELALRYYAFKYCIESYRGKLKEFLDDTCNYLNREWCYKQSCIEEDFKQLEASIEFTFEIFGEKDAFSRYTKGKYNKNFNRALYEIFTYYFSIPEIRESLKDKKDEFKLKFEKISGSDTKFNDSVASTTKDVNRIEYRFSVMYDLLNGLISCRIPKLINDNSRFFMQY